MGEGGGGTQMRTGQVQSSIAWWPDNDRQLNCSHPLEANCTLQKLDKNMKKNVPCNLGWEMTERGASSQGSNYGLTFYEYNVCTILCEFISVSNHNFYAESGALISACSAWECYFLGENKAGRYSVFLLLRWHLLEQADSKYHPLVKHTRQLKCGMDN